MYEGQAKIILCEDTACTKQLSLAPNGDYVVIMPITTGHSNGLYRKNIYMKNVGTHKAYNIVVSEVSDESNKFTVTPPSVSTLDGSTGRTKIEIVTSYIQGERSNNRLILRVNYDNIP